MSEDPGKRTRPATVTRHRDTAEHIEQRGVGISSKSATTTPPPKPVTQPQPDGASLSARHGHQGIDSPRLNLRLAMPLIALPRVKVSALLVSFIVCVLVPAFAATVYLAFIASNQLAI
jgi:hypothetical protein